MGAGAAQRGANGRLGLRRVAGRARLLQQLREIRVRIA